MNRRLLASILWILLLVGSVSYMAITSSAKVMGQDSDNAATVGQRLIVEGVEIERSSTVAAEAAIEPAAIVMNENFEAGWPGAGWTREDRSASDEGEYLWGKRTCSPRTGSFAGWAAGSGAQGDGRTCTDNYPNNLDTWAIYGPFDLSGATAASLNFHFWGVTEVSENCAADQLYVASSTDSVKFSGQYFCGDWRQGEAGQGYYQYSLDLSKRLGQQRVWIGFAFKSNGSITANGIAIDDLVLDVTSGSVPTPAPTFSISGRVTNNAGAGIPDVTITAAGPTIKSAVTDGNGNYTISGLAGGNYELTPFKTGYAFAPPVLPINLLSNVTDINFAGALASDVYIIDVKPIQVVEDATLVAGKRTAIKVRIGVNSYGASNVRVKIVYDGRSFSTFYPHTDENLIRNGTFKQSTTAIDIPSYVPVLDVYFFPNDLFWPKTAGRYSITAVVEANGDANPNNNQKTVEQPVVRTLWNGDDDIRLFIAGIEGYSNYVIADKITFAERTFPVADLNFKVRYASTTVSLSNTDEVFCLYELGLPPKCRMTGYGKQLWKAALLADPATDRVIGVTPPNKLNELFGKGTQGVAAEDFVTGKPFGALIFDGNAVVHTMAHELGHTYGLYLPPCEGYNPDCNPSTPPVAGLPVLGGVDSFGGSLKHDGLKAGDATSHVYDFMGDTSYNPPEFDRWVALDTYQQLIKAATRVASVSGPDMASSSSVEQPVVLIAGLIKATGQYSLDPYYLLPDGVPSDLPSQGDILIQLEGENSEVLYQGALSSSIRYLDTDLTPLDAVPLAISVPFPTDTRYIVIKLFEQEIDRRPVSSNPPSITLLSPQPNQLIDQSTSITWQTLDADGDATKVSVLLSSDGGQTWQTVAMDVEATSYVVDTRSLPPGSNYWIKLIATDGVRTGSTISGPFSISAKLYMPLMLASSNVTAKATCGQFIRIQQTLDKWPAFLPYNSNEPWVIDPSIFAIFEEGHFAEIVNPSLGADLGPIGEYPNAKYLKAYSGVTAVPNCHTP